jgi:hypothetical protein
VIGIFFGNNVKSLSVSGQLAVSGQGQLQFRGRFQSSV